MRKKIISLILAGTMVLTMVPGMALAGNTDEPGGTQEPPAVTEPGTSEDNQLAGTIEITKSKDNVKYAPKLVAVAAEDGEDVDQGEVTETDFNTNNVKDFIKLSVTFTPGDALKADNSKYRMTITNKNKTAVDGLQLIYQNGEEGRWWDITKAGFGPHNGATIEQLLGDGNTSLSKDIYAVSNKPGKDYELRMNLVQVSAGEEAESQADEDNIVGYYDFTLKTEDPFGGSLQVPEDLEITRSAATVSGLTNGIYTVSEGKENLKLKEDNGLTPFEVTLTDPAMAYMKQDSEHYYRATITDKNGAPVNDSKLQVLIQDETGTYDTLKVGYGPVNGFNFDENVGESYSQDTYIAATELGLKELKFNLVQYDKPAAGEGGAEATAEAAAGTTVYSEDFNFTVVANDTDVAQIGNTGYASLEAAITAAQDNQTIQLLKNEIELGATEKLTVNSSINIIGAENGTVITRAEKPTTEPTEKLAREASIPDNNCAVVVTDGKTLGLKGITFEGIDCENSPVIGLAGGTVKIEGQVKFNGNDAIAAIAPLEASQTNADAVIVDSVDDAALISDSAIEAKVTASGKIDTTATLTLAAGSTIKDAANVSAAKIIIAGTTSDKVKVEGTATVKANAITRADEDTSTDKILVVTGDNVVSGSGVSDLLDTDATGLKGVIIDGKTATVYGQLTSAINLKDTGVDKVVITDGAGLGDGGKLTVPNNTSVENKNTADDSDITVTTPDGNKTTVGAGETATAKPKPSTGTGGGSTPAPAKPEISTGDGYTASLSTDGTKATITVADGYVLKDVLVNGVSKGAVTTVEGLKTGDKVEIVVEKAQPEDPNAELKAGIQATTITADSKTAKGYIYLSWEKSGNYDVDGYQIYRQDTKDGEFQPYAKTQKTTFGNTAKLKKGNTYSYKIRGYKTVDGEEIWTKESNVTSKKLTQTHAEYLKKGVQNTKISIYSKSAKGSVTITWKKQAGFKVDGYQVYRSDKKTAGFKKMTSRTTMKYKNTKGLKKGKKYYYKVRGYRTVDGKTVYTKWSKTIYRTAK